MSPSKNPGSDSNPSPDLRILIEDRNNTCGFVAATPLIRSVAFAGFRYRSIDAAEIARSSPRRSCTLCTTSALRRAVIARVLAVPALLPVLGLALPAVTLSCPLSGWYGAHCDRYGEHDECEDGGPPDHLLVKVGQIDAGQ